jgi:hypothetical protein
MKESVKHPSDRHSPRLTRLALFLEAVDLVRIINRQGLIGKEFLQLRLANIFWNGRAINICLKAELKSLFMA